MFVRKMWTRKSFIVNKTESREWLGLLWCLHWASSARSPPGLSPLVGSIGKSHGQVAQRGLGWRQVLERAVGREPSVCWNGDEPGKALGSQLSLELICSSPECELIQVLVVFYPCSDISYQMNYFSWETPGIGRYLTSLSIQGFSFLFLLFLIETNLLWRLRTLVCGICRRRKWVS